MKNFQGNSQLKIFIIFNLIILFLAFNALAIDRNIPKTNEEWDKAWASLNWKDGPSVVNYNQANSKISIPSNFQILEGKEAHQLLYWINGVDFDYVDDSNLTNLLKDQINSSNKLFNSFISQNYKRLISSDQKKYFTPYTIKNNLADSLSNNKKTIPPSTFINYF